MKTLILSMVAGLALCACSTNNTKTEINDTVDTVEVVDSVSDTVPLCECDE